MNFYITSERYAEFALIDVVVVPQHLPVQEMKPYLFGRIGASYHQKRVREKEVRK